MKKEQNMKIRFDIGKLDFLWYLVIYAAMQMGATVVVNAVLWLATGEWPKDLTTTIVIAATILCNLATILLFTLVKWTPVSRSYIKSRPWAASIWCAVAALGAMIPSMWMQELIPDLQDNMKTVFEGMMQSPWGYVSIGLMAPLAEETVFRGAILRRLLDSKWNPWFPICISALLFAIIHMNPAQMPHAFLMGLLLGWMYHRTGSIIPGVIVHWVNNSIAFLIYNLVPGSSDMTLLEFFKGSQQHVYMALGFSMLILLPALFQLNIWLRRSDEAKTLSAQV